MKVDMVDNASGPLAALAERLGNMTPMMQAFGRHMMTSVRSNFLQGGRPFAWEPLKDVYIEAAAPGNRRTKRKGRQQGLARMGGPLVLTGNLKDSITFMAYPNDLTLTTSDGLDPEVKGPVHQWGTDRAGRGHNVVIPARPFLVFQPEDVDWFRNSVLGWVRTGVTPR